MMTDLGLSAQVRVWTESPTQPQRLLQQDVTKSGRVGTWRETFRGQLDEGKIVVRN